MIGDIKKHVQEYMKCQQERDYYEKRVEYEIRRLKTIWKKMSIDHIIKLSRIREKDNILVIKD